LHGAIARVLQGQSASSSNSDSVAEERSALLAHHWLGAEDWERALKYTVEAAKWAEKLHARPEAISRYSQALHLLDKMPTNADNNRIHAELVLALATVPGSMQGAAAHELISRHVDKALENALLAEDEALGARLQTIKGIISDEEALLVEGLRRAKAGRRFLGRSTCGALLRAVSWQARTVREIARPCGAGGRASWSSQ
jgi:hypothetical protein